MQRKKKRNEYFILSLFWEQRRSRKQWAGLNIPSFFTLTAHNSECLWLFAFLPPNSAGAMSNIFSLDSMLNTSPIWWYGILWLNYKLFILLVMAAYIERCPSHSRCFTWKPVLSPCHFEQRVNLGKRQERVTDRKGCKEPDTSGRLNCKESSGADRRCCSS